MKLVANKELLFLILAIILLRLPSLNRPLSKHHEFNVAVTLINAESWEQGGAANFNYTPLMNYQGNSNRLLEKGFHVDSLQNHVYISIGAGAFVLPYLLLQLFHLPFTVVWLQCLNMLLNVLTVVLLFRLIFTVTANKKIAIATAALFALMPSVLWYGGNGYVNTDAMLPLVVLILHQWHRIETSGQATVKDLIILFLLSVLLSYFDWFPVFLIGMMMLWALLRLKRGPSFTWIVIVGALSLVTGVFIVLYQFAAYCGWDNVLHYWSSRFIERSADTSRFSATTMLWMISKNLVSGYLPLLLLLPAIFVRRKAFAAVSKISWPVWALAAIVPYNGLFFNWSAEHEFAWLAFGLLASICVGVYLLPAISDLRLKQVVISSALVSLIIYFIINRPGAYSWRGDAYAEQKNLGAWIRSHVDPNLPIFTNLANDKITEFYSKRTFNDANNIDTAINICKQFDVQKAVWLHIDANRVDHVTYIFNR